MNLPSRRRPGQGVKVHPSWWVSHHHAAQGLFTMIGRHRVARRLSNVYWGTTLNCILPTPSAPTKLPSSSYRLPGSNTGYQAQAIKLPGYRHLADRDGYPLRVPVYQAIKLPGCRHRVDRGFPSQSAKLPGSTYQIARTTLTATRWIHQPSGV